MKLKEILEQAKKTGGEKPGKAIGLKGVNPALFLKPPDEFFISYLAALFSQ